MAAKMSSTHPIGANRTHPSDSHACSFDIDPLGHVHIGPTVV